MEVARIHKSLQVILFPVMSTQKRAWLIVACCLLLFASEGQAQEDLPNPLEQIEPHWTSYVAIVDQADFLYQAL